MNIYIAVTKNPFTPQYEIKTEDYSKSLGKNSGNLLFAYATSKYLDNENNNITYGSIGDIDLVNKQDMLVIPAANWIAKYFIEGLKNMTKVIDKIEIPITILGLGAQSSLDYDYDFLNEDEIKVVKNFLSVISKKTQKIGVRGEFTRKYLSKLGFNNVMTMGCPSCFINGANFKIDNYKKSSPSLISGNSNPHHTQFNDFLIKNKVFYVDQEPVVVTKIIDEKEVKISDFRKSFLENNRYKMFGDIPVWLDYMKQMDFTIGSRIHGIMTSVISGTPAHLFCHDSRTKELAEFFSIPYTIYDDNLDFTKLNMQEIYNNSDFSKFNENYNGILDNFYNFLTINGLKELSLFEKNTDFEAKITKNIDVEKYRCNEEKPNIDGNTTDKYFRYPDKTDKRKLEGGLRLSGRYKMSQKNKPLVTVITVVYNNEVSLEKTINSVLNQSYDNIEYIVIDGGSSDRTLDLIEKYKDSIDYFVSEPDKGIYDAMNKGLSLAGGDYIGILNSDDIYLKDAVKISIDKIVTNSSDGSAAIANMYDNNGQFLWKYNNLPFDDNAYLTRNPCNHQTLFLSKKGYNLIGSFDTNLKYAADLNSEYLMIQNNLNITRINEVIVQACFEGGATEQNYVESQKEAYEVASRFTNLSPKEHMIIADYMYGAKKPDASFFEKIFKNHSLSISQFSKIFKKYYKEDRAKSNNNVESILASVIIPAFNVEDDIPRCLDSIINQTHENIEIIVVNDASTDRTSDIVEKYMQKDSRIICINKQENAGLLQARMTGIEKAKGEYIYSVDSDDYVMPGLVKDTLTEALEHDADIVQFPMKFSASDRKYTHNWTVKNYKEYNKNDFFYHNANSWTVMFKKELGMALNRCTNFLSVNYHEDYIISIILSAFYKKARYLNTAYYVYCDTDVSMTRQYSDNALLNYIRDTLVFGRLMKDLVPVIFPKENVNYLYAVLSNRIGLLKNQFSFYFRERNNIDIHNLYKSTDDNKIFIMYSMLNDVIHIKDEQLQSRSNQLQNKNEQLQNKNEQLQNKNEQLQSKINALMNNKWYRFGKLSRKRKIWTIGKVLSKKMRIHWALKPFAQVIKKSIKK